jgi:hypothetical protein
MYKNNGKESDNLGVFSSHRRLTGLPRSGSEFSFAEIFPSCETQSLVGSLKSPSLSHSAFRIMQKTDASTEFLHSWVSWRETTMAFMTRDFRSIVRKEVD